MKVAPFLESVKVAQAVTTVEQLFLRIPQQNVYEWFEGTWLCVFVRFLLITMMTCNMFSIVALTLSLLGVVASKQQPLEPLAKFRNFLYLRL